MLQSIRKHTQGTAAKIVIGLIVISFAGFGIQQILVGGSSNAVAEVNGEEIGAVKVQQLVNIQKRRLINMFGDNLDPAMLDDQRLRGEVINGVIERTLLSQRAEKLKLAISEKQLGAVISGMEQFQVDGSFSPELYKNALASSGYSPASFKQQLRQDLLINQLQAGLFASEFATPQEVSSNTKLLKEQRDVRYMTLPMDAFVEQQDPADSEIQDFYQNNRERFMTEESVDVSYIELSPEDFYEPVSEEALREEYKLQTSAREYRDENRVSHILLIRGDDESADEFDARVQEVQQAVAQGMDFADAARKYSDDAGSAGIGGDLGFSSGEAFPDEMENAIAELSEGEISEPVQTDAGTHIIKLVERREGEPPAFAEMRAELEQRVQEREAEKELLLAVEELRNLAFNADNLQSPASELGVTVEQADGITREQSEGLFANQSLRSAAFSNEVLVQGHNSPVVELSDNRYVTMRVRTHREPELKPLEQVRAEIVADINRTRAREQLAAAAADAVQALRSGDAEMDTYANEHGFEWNVELGVERDSQLLPPALNQRVFAVAAPEQGGKRFGYVTLPESDMMVFELVRVRPGNPDALTAEERQQMIQRTRSELAQLSNAEYRDTLRRKADIEIY